MPLLIAPEEWTRHRSRAGPARAAAQPDPRRPLRPAAAAARGVAAARAGLRQSRLPAAVPRPRRRPGTATCTCTPSTSRARPTASWWVLADRTQAPSGAGYALENRIVLSRAAARRIPRLPRPAAGGFFQAFARHLAPPRAARARTSRASCCSRPARTTRPISSTPTSRATSASRWSKAAT